MAGRSIKTVQFSITAGDVSVYITVGDDGSARGTIRIMGCSFSVDRDIKILIKELEDLKDCVDEAIRFLRTVQDNIPFIMETILGGRGQNHEHGEAQH